MLSTFEKLFPGDGRTEVIFPQDNAQKISLVRRTSGLTSITNRQRISSAARPLKINATILTRPCGQGHWHV